MTCLPLLVTVLCVELVASSSSKQATCTARSVVERQPGSVTCTFPVNVTKQKQYVNILRYYFNGNSFLPELVLKCFWRQHSETPDCSVADGFDFDGQISDTVTVTIREATKKNHAGMYACDYAGAAPSEISGCKLHVKNSRISCSAPPANLGHPTHVKCQFNSDLRHTKDHFYVSRIGPDLRSKPEDVVTCNWIGDQEKYFCFTKDGYNFNTDEINDTITIGILALEERHTGRYYCHTVPVERGVKAEHCNLRVENVTTQTPTTTPGPVSGSCVSFRSWNVSAFMMVLLRFLIECATIP